MKLSLVALALAWGGFHNVLVKPAVARAGSGGFLGRVRTSLLGEGAVGVAILLAPRCSSTRSRPRSRRSRPTQAQSAATPTAR